MVWCCLHQCCRGQIEQGSCNKILGDICRGMPLRQRQQTHWWQRRPVKLPRQLPRRPRRRKPRPASSRFAQMPHQLRHQQPQSHQPQSHQLQSHQPQGRQQEAGCRLSNMQSPWLHSTTAAPQAAQVMERHLTKMQSPCKHSFNI